MNKVRIKKLSFSSHLLYLSLTGAVGGAIYGVILMIAVGMNVSTISLSYIPLIIGTFLGAIISGIIIGLIGAVVSYKLINLILCGDYFIINGSISEEI